VVHLPSDWTLFGLTPEYKLVVNQEIFDLVFHGKGFTYHDAYNMPVHIRHFFVRKLQKYFEDQRSAEEKAAKEARGRRRSKK
jgi:hypothetical protein